MVREQRQISLGAAVLLAALVAVVASAVTFVVGRGPGTSAPIDAEPVGTVRDLMRMLDPSADAVWESVGFVITLDGETEIAPADEDEWLRLESHAVTLMAAGRALEFPGRDADAQWNGYARALVDAGRTALTALRARDKDAVMSAGEQITISCDNCHYQYWDDTNVVLEQ